MHRPPARITCSNDTVGNAGGKGAATGSSDRTVAVRYESSIQEKARLSGPCARFARGLVQNSFAAFEKASRNAS